LGELRKREKNFSAIWKNSDQQKRSDASLHLETQKTSVDEIEMAYLEDNGRISFIVKKQ